MPASTDHLRLLTSELDAIIAQGHRPWEVFVDWVALSFWGFQRNDDEYLAVMNRYEHGNRLYIRGRRPADHFTNALGALLGHMKATNEETLGPLYEQYAANHFQGQYFTPASVSRAAAKMTAAGGAVRGRIGDPACGAGSMLVGMAKEMTCRDVDQSLFVGVDVDIHCARMATLNMVFFNLPAVIVHGDTLRGEGRAGWVTSRSYSMGGCITQTLNAGQATEWIVGPLKAGLKQPEPRAEVRQIQNVSDREEQRPPVWVREQMRLFG